MKKTLKDTPTESPSQRGGRNLRKSALGHSSLRVQAGGLWSKCIFPPYPVLKSHRIVCIPIRPRNFWLFLEKKKKSEDGEAGRGGLLPGAPRWAGGGGTVPLPGPQSGAAQLTDCLPSAWPSESCTGERGVDGGGRAVGFLLGWGAHTLQHLWDSHCPCESPQASAQEAPNQRLRVRS